MQYKHMPSYVPPLGVRAIFFLPFALVFSFPSTPSFILFHSLLLEVLLPLKHHLCETPPL
jgi:hypothetical protein